MHDYSIQPIGVIKTPFKTLEGMPIQPAGAKDVKGEIIIDPAYEQGLSDLDGFSHIILLYLFHRSKGFDLKVTPFLDNRQRGLFSTRAPRRPNPIGLSVVEILGTDQNRVLIKGIDVLDDTPLVDIKPFVPKFDLSNIKGIDTIRSGWIEKTNKEVRSTRSDKRFVQNSE